MAFSGLLITEIFRSLQGESTAVGLPFIFIRLTGCNLRCSYCDSAHAFHGGIRMSLDEVVSKVKPFKIENVLITGGEPLLQRNTIELMESLIAHGFSVSVETHGEVSIQKIPKQVRIVMDIKTPGSSMDRGTWKENIPHLKTGDEVKFVLTSKDDYSWAKDILTRTEFRTRNILFSAAQPHPDSPQAVGGLDPTWLADQILKDGLNVRFQLQLHKILWGNRTGV